ncbi:hypothetical protein D9758_013205 [Tetrapyrgos nigripes]|uniref:CCHC-type domain-containing protein n=1 Tax=Tetrapyrgos nigripes TaxID=182062 RepID=A0A8H5CRH1_9AGAR|nr:hypothetical protein D9758_013205 [Tetrapyrgos nigripes]
MSTHTSMTNPYTMDIDATHTGNGKTCEDYLCAMQNHCYGCGAPGHMKPQCNHKEAKCNYCAWKGHLDCVCKDKFMGLERNRGLRPQGQQVAATTTDDYFTLFPSESPTPSTSTTATIPPPDYST